MIDFSPVVRASNKLTADIFATHEELRKVDPALSRRLMVTQIFVQMAVLASLVRSVINAHYDGGKDDVAELDPSDILVSHGEDYRIDEDGNAAFSEKKISTLPHVLYTLRFAARVQRRAFDPKCEAHWADVKPALRIRNRVTHPKSPEDLDVTDDELTVAMNSLLWFISCLDKLGLK